MSNSYQLLESEVVELAVFCLPTLTLPKKWKPAVNHSKPKVERKGRGPFALKAAGGRLKPETALPTASHKEETETVRYTTESRTCTLEGRRQSAAIGTQAEESQLEVTEDDVIQVLERPYSTSYFLPGKLERRPVQFLVDTGCTTNLLSKHIFDRPRTSEERSGGE